MHSPQGSNQPPLTCRRYGVIGSGASGLAITAHLVALGHKPKLWLSGGLRSFKDGYLANGEINCFVPKDRLATSIEDAITEADCIFIATPGMSHPQIANEIKPFLTRESLVFLTPGRAFGARYFYSTLGESSRSVSILEAETELHACRVTKRGVSISGIKALVKFCGRGPGDVSRFMRAIPHNYSKRYEASLNPMEITLGNVSYVLHCIAAIKFAEKRQKSLKNTKFYRECFDPHTVQEVHELDEERISVARAIGIPVRNICDWLSQSYGTPISDLHTMFTNTPAYANLSCMLDATHRYITDDVPTGLVALEHLAIQHGVQSPTCTNYINRAEALTGMDLRATGRHPF